MGIKGMRERRSQVPLLAQGHWCVYETHTHYNTDTHIHTYTCSSFPCTPSGKNSLVFIIWLQICVSAFTVHMVEENEQQLLLFAAFCLSTSLAFHRIFALSQCWWDWRNRPILILSGSRSALPLYLSVCSVQGRALTLLPQRIRHAECWGPLHTKRLGIRRKRPQCGLRDSDQIPNLNRISNIKQIGGGCFWRLFIDCIYCWRELSKICRCYQRQIIHSLLESTWNSSAVHTHLKSFI